MKAEPMNMSILKERKDKKGLLKYRRLRNWKNSSSCEDWRMRLE
jgi:hypothetical protein